MDNLEYQLDIKPEWNLQLNWLLDSLLAIICGLTAGQYKDMVNDMDTTTMVFRRFSGKLFFVIFRLYRYRVFRLIENVFSEVSYYIDMFPITFLLCRRNQEKNSYHFRKKHVKTFFALAYFSG